MTVLETALIWAAVMGLLYVVVAALGIKARRRNAAILAERQDRADRTKGVVAVEDHTADDITGVMDAVAECPSVALAEHAGGYACELDAGHPLPHRNGVWVWDAGDDILIDLGAAADLVASVHREANPTYDEPYQIVDGWGRHDIWPEPQPTLREESLPVAEVDTLAEPYIARDLVPYGLGLVHAGCLAARRDHATDHICGDCGRRMAAAGLPS